MQQAIWSIDDDQICLVRPDGSRMSLSATEIYSAAFGGVRSIGGLLLKTDPITALSSIKFSRYPAELMLCIEGGNSSPITAKLCVKSEGRLLELGHHVDQIIANGTWYPIVASLLAESRDWLSANGLNENLPLTLGQLITLRTSVGCPIPVIDNLKISSSELACIAGAGVGDVPGLNAVLYPYQKDGVGFLKVVAEQGLGCILADEMGLGKTLQAISLLLVERAAGRAPSLIVSPATIIENWRRELKEFAPELNVWIHAGGERSGLSRHFLEKDVVIVSYDTVIRDQIQLSLVSWNLVILDEAQAIKNPEAKRTMAVKSLPRRVSIAVTGTPVENKLDDLWSIVDFAIPKMLGDINAFRLEYADNVENAGRLGRLISPVILRRKVVDVAKDLPEKIEMLQPVMMNEQSAEQYESLRLSAIEEYGAAGNMVAITKLRMLCAHPKLVEVSCNDALDSSQKYIRLLELLEEIFLCGEKVLVFTTYQGMVDILLADIPKRWPAGFFKFIDGRVPVEQRQTIVDEFYLHSGCGGLFLNPKAAGAGLNITAANHVIHYNPEWNPALTAQATARAYRRKQKRPVTIHHLYYADTIEAHIVERADYKRQLATEAVVGHVGDIDSTDIVKALQISPIKRH